MADFPISQRLQPGEWETIHRDNAMDTIRQGDEWRDCPMCNASRRPIVRGPHVLRCGNCPQCAGTGRVLVVEAAGAGFDPEWPAYGYELVMDLHRCDPALFTRASLEGYFKRVCNGIGMKREDLHFWDDQGLPPEKCQTNPKTKGTSAVQFIITSSIVVHCLDLLKAVYVNVFSCKPYDRDFVEAITITWFCADTFTSSYIVRT